MERESLRIWQGAVLLTLLSGAAALSHQVLWTRRMVDLLGAGSESTVRVFAGFFLGLAVGSAIGGYVAGRVRRAWRALGVAEICCGVLAVPLVLLPMWTGGLWQRIGPEGLDGVAGQGIKLLMPLLLVTPPSILMGFFLPIIAKAVLREDRRFGKEGLVLYGMNTLGGVLGIGVTTLLLLPALGALGAMWAVLGLNVAVACGCFLLSLTEGEGRRPWFENQGSGAGTVVVPQMWIGGIALFSGFVILVSEVALFEMLQLVSPLSFYAPSALLIVVLVALALSAFAVPKLAKRMGSARLLAAACMGSGLLSVLTPWLFYLLARHGWGLFQAGEFWIYFVSLLAFSFFVIGPLFLVGGLVFPAVCAAQEDAADDKSGRTWGMLLAINGLGGFLGAEAAYRVLLPWLGIYGTIVFTGALYAVAAFWLLWWEWQRHGIVLRGGLLLVLLLGVVAALPTVRLPVVNPDLPFEVLHTESGRHGTLAVIEGRGLGRGILLHNQYLLGSTGSRAEQLRMGNLPLLLHSQPERVCFIGLATGITPSAGLLHAGVKELTAVEISPSVYRAALNWFGSYNHEIATNPGARIVIEDGRTFIAAHNQTFDVIVGDLFLPWGPGEGRLYSVEHFRAVREALRAGGAFMQWLPMHQLTEGQLDRIVASFVAVFPDVDLFTAGFEAGQPLLGLLGWREGKIDWAAVGTRIQQEAHWLRDPVLSSRSGVAMLYLGSFSPAGVQGVTANTLNNMFLELEAGRRVVVSDHPEPFLVGSHWLRLREQWLRQNLFESLPDDLRPWPSAASQLTEIYWHARQDPEQASRAMEISRRYFPVEVLYQRGADWTQWPGLPPWR